MSALGSDAGFENLKIRFHVGFEVGDVLVDKDPTLGKLIIARDRDGAAR